MKQPPDSPLLAATAAVYGARHEHYGHPRDNHQRTAQMWNAYLGRWGTFAQLTARDVCMLNILQKISRDAHSPIGDNLVDIAGYAENAHLCSDAVPPDSGE